jgi:hypothetical protein
MTRFEELLEGHLAGKLAPEDERDFAALLAQEAHRRAFAAHQKTAALLEGVRRVPPLSPSFTEEVMARLPDRRPSLWEQASEILWARRALHWNLASALALGLVLAVAPLVWRALPDRGPGPAGLRPPATVIRFTLHAPGAERVSLVGDFNGWRSDEILLSDTTGRGHFSGALPLRPGRYAYMFVVDGSTWVTDPTAEGHRDDGFGNRNAVVTVSDTEPGHDDT